MVDESHETFGPHREGERRWPMAVTVVTALGLTFLRPDEVRVFPAWMLPAVEVVLLAVLIMRDPGRIDRRSNALRAISICVVSLLVLDALVATAHLIVVLIEGGTTTSSAGALLAAGAIVWVSNVIVFGLLYWERDSGGSAARFSGASPYPDLAFPQQTNPELAPPGWRPEFLDYLYLGLTASTAFSPTDVLPLARWAKVAMGVQSLVSLVVIGLVIARAVNVMT